MRDDLSSKLLASDAVAALATERDIAELLDKLGWDVVHSMFYTDAQSKKRRELDTSARSIWSSRSDDGTGAGCAVRLLVEAKSAAGYHVVFAPSRHAQRDYALPECWMGDESAVERAVREILALGVPINDVKDFRSELLFLAQGGDVDGLHVLAPKAAHRSTSFKETNVGTEKDLDNSVLWRAVLAVDSALHAAIEDEIGGRLEDIRGRIAIDELYGYPPLPHVMEDLKPVLTFRECYHPIVVIEAGLWQLEGDVLAKIDWCRFEQRDESHMVARWVDVVQRAHFARYARTITAHYNRVFTRVGAERLPRRAA